MKAYNETSIIDRVTRNNKANMPYYNLFVHVPLVRAYLRKDQINLILHNINPTKNVG